MSQVFSSFSAMTAVRGVFAILFGLVALAWPGITLTALVALFGAFVLVEGIAALTLAISNPQTLVPRWVLALEGVSGVAAAVVTFFFPGITSLALLYIIAVWALVTGSLLIGAAVAGPRFEPAWLMVLQGAISLIVGIALISAPGSGILAIVWALGLFAIFRGVSLLIASIRLGRGALRLNTSSSGRTSDAPVR
jgi:uncharacterized membrane protein HdeD (DUF308 family)